MNFADWLDFSDAADGVKGTTPIVGLSEIVELAVALTSAKAVAVRTTVWGVLMIIGALYRPLVTVPTRGKIDHLTAPLVVPLTDALNRADCPEVREAVEGIRVTAIPPDW